MLAQVRGAIGSRVKDDLAIMTLEDALIALGENGITELGQRDVPLEQVVGTAGRCADFDRRFRPLNAQSRDRWQRIASVSASGIDLPPVDLVVLGEMYFVRDGHHRVSVARALGRPTITARVRRICTIAYGMGCLLLKHLPAKAAERLFLERVPLPDDVRTDLWLDDPAEWMRLADAAEAWAFRNILAGREVKDRDELADSWWREEVVPTIERMRDDGKGHDLRDVQAYVTALASRDRLVEPFRTPM
ncbi:hypothetical protein [Flindersiella endophytica]